MTRPSTVTSTATAPPVERARHSATLRPLSLQRRNPTGPHQTLAKARALISRHCGLFPSIDVARIGRPLDALFAYRVELERATLHGVRALTRHRAATPDAWCREPYVEGRVGYSPALSRDAAFVRALGEAIERYANATGYDPARLVTASFRDIADHALDPRTFQTYDADEYARVPTFSPFSTDAPMRWTWAADLMAPDDPTRARLVPAQFVWLMVNPIPGEPVLKQGTGTGWAAHNTREEALVKCLDEIMERDAYVITWTNRLVRPRIDLDALSDPVVVRTRNLLADVGARLHVVDTTTDTGYPTYLAAAVNEHTDEAALTVTMGAGLDPVDGIRRAAEEALGSYLLNTAFTREGATVETAADVVGMLDHFRYYTVAAHRDAIAWLWSGPLQAPPEPSDPPPTPLDAVEARVARLHAAGMHAYAVDTTPTDVHEAGFRTMKALVPEACQIEFGHGLIGRDHDRLYQAAVRMGARATPLDAAELNTDIHPHS